MPLPPPIASGRTAEIYPWPDGRVLKLIRPGFPPFLADQEERGARIAYQITGCAPQPGPLLEIDGRRGVLLERISGPTVMAELDRRPYRVVAFARLLGGLHARLNAAAAPELPSQRERVLWMLEDRSPNIPADLKPSLLRLLERQPDGDRLCHGDFHTYNVILSPRGPVVVDWEPATRGSPAGDVAETCLSTRRSTARLPGPRGILYRFIGRLFNAAYLRAYRRASAYWRCDPLEGLEDWIAIRAALHMQADNRAEWPMLERILRARLAKINS